jgi:hypothetical protein
MGHIQRALGVGLFVLIAVVIALPAAAGDIVAFNAGPSGITWRPLIQFEHGVLTIGTPDGLVFQDEFKAGESVSFNPFAQEYKASDGTYRWQILLGRPSTVDPKLRDAARAKRGDGDPDIEALHRAASTRATQVQSGAFTIQNGAIVPSDLTEPRVKSGDGGPRGMAPVPFRQADWPQDDPSVQPVDQVIPDDLIVQGSLCVGFDCVNNESFGFDTIRLKENNTRIKFEDTSVGTFPTNDWQLTANDSASGGASKFSIEDITGARVPFTIQAGATTNSIFVDSSGRVGFRTSTPVLDLHVNTSNTPAMRLEQNNSGGFTAQTWDVGPGAPTSSIDIAASGNVGIGTASPGRKLALSVAAGDGISLGDRSVAGNLFVGRTVTNSFGGNSGWMNFGQSGAGIDNFIAFGTVQDGVGGGERVRITNIGNVGIGTTSPGARLHTTGTVRFAGVANCSAGIQSNAAGDLSCVASSREFKNVAGDLEPRVALANVMALRPQVGSYKETPNVPEHWLIAEETAAVDPALVGLADGKPHTVKTQNVVADLIAVVQQQQRWIEQQQRLIEQQQRRLEALERAAPPAQ